MAQLRGRIPQKLVRGALLLSALVLSAPVGFT